MINAQVNKYQNVGVTTASKEMLILLAYEGAIKFINQARMHIENGNIPQKCERISRAMAIIGELSASLNMEQGGEIAENLLGLYDYMTRRLLEANLNSDVKILDEISSLLKTLYDGWVEGIAKLDIAAPKVRPSAPAPQPVSIAQGY